MRVTYKDGDETEQYRYCSVCGDFTEHHFQMENDVWAECIQCHQKLQNFPKKKSVNFIIGEVIQAIVYITFLVCILTWPIVLILGYLLFSYSWVAYVIIASKGFGWVDGLYVWFYSPFYLPLMFMCVPLI